MNSSGDWMYLHPGGVPPDIWYEIATGMIAPEVPLFRGIYRLRQTCSAIRAICDACLRAARSPALIHISPTEFMSVEIPVYRTVHPRHAYECIASGLVVHFEWITDQNLSIAMWRSIGGIAATNIISCTINMHYHDVRVPVITTIVGIRTCGRANDISVAFTTNNEGGFTLITLNTSEAIAVSHELNPIKYYDPVVSHADLLRADLLDARSMDKKICGLFCEIMSQADVDAVNRIVIADEQSRAFDALGMTTDTDFHQLMSILRSIARGNNVLPSHAIVALIRDKPWVVNTPPKQYV